MKMQKSLVVLGNNKSFASNRNLLAFKKDGICSLKLRRVLNWKQVQGRLVYLKQKMFLGCYF